MYMHVFVTASDFYKIFLLSNCLWVQIVFWVFPYLSLFFLDCHWNSITTGNHTTEGATDCTRDKFRYQCCWTGCWWRVPGSSPASDCGYHSFNSTDTCAASSENKWCQHFRWGLKQVHDYIHEMRQFSLLLIVFSSTLYRLRYNLRMLYLYYILTSQSDH